MHVISKFVSYHIVKFYFSEENLAMVATRLQNAGKRNASVIQKPSKKCEARSLIMSVSDPSHRSLQPIFMLASSNLIAFLLIIRELHVVST